MNRNIFDQSSFMKTLKKQKHKQVKGRKGVLALIRAVIKGMGKCSVKKQ